MIQIAHRTEPYVGEQRNGDGVVARVGSDRTQALCAVVDGLGHGPHAADVTEHAIDFLEHHPMDAEAVEVMRGLHDVLKGSRGAVATICVIKNGFLSACGVGNVSMRTHGADVPFVLSPGILGARIRNLKGVNARLRRGARLVLHSDGISSAFALDTVGHLDASSACSAIFDAHRRTTDDATILVVDVRG